MADLLLGVDWRTMLVPTQPILESFLRTTVVYLSLVGLFRVVLKREAASIQISDLLVLVLVSDAVQNAMAGEYKSISDGLILAGTLIFWNWALSYASMRWRGVSKVLHPAPLLLVRDGRMIQHNMRKEHLTEGELMSQVRQQGIERLDEVRFAFMEMDGRISVIQKESKQNTAKAPERGAF